MTRWAAGAYPGSWPGTCFHSNRSCRLVPAHQGMKSRSCDLVQRIGAADSATPHPDPIGGQAPRLAKSSTALHFLIPPSTIGLQIGTFRRWRAGIEVDWRAHFRTNDESRGGNDEAGGGNDELGGCIEELRRGHDEVSDCISSDSLLAGISPGSESGTCFHTTFED